jgi:hypothetical protein
MRCRIFDLSETGAMPAPLDLDVLLCHKGLFSNNAGGRADTDGDHGGSRPRSITPQRHARPPDDNAGEQTREGAGAERYTVSEMVNGIYDFELGWPGRSPRMSAAASARPR